MGELERQRRIKVHQHSGIERRHAIDERRPRMCLRTAFAGPAQSIQHKRLALRREYGKMLARMDLHTGDADLFAAPQFFAQLRVVMFATGRRCQLVRGCVEIIGRYFLRFDERKDIESMGVSVR